MSELEDLRALLKELEDEMAEADIRLIRCTRARSELEDELQDASDNEQDAEDAYDEIRDKVNDLKERIREKE